MKRRQTLKVLSTLPLLAVFPAFAADPVKKEAKKNAKKAAGGASKKLGKLTLIDEKDTLASAMQYKHDASKVGPMRSDKKANCANCAKYNVCMDGDADCKPLSKADLKKSDVAPCQIFKGKLVKAEGWCLSWQKKA